MDFAQTIHYTHKETQYANVLHTQTQMWTQQCHLKTQLHFITTSSKWFIEQRLSKEGEGTESRRGREQKRRHEGQWQRWRHTLCSEVRLKTGSFTKEGEDENMKVIWEEKQGYLHWHTHKSKPSYLMCCCQEGEKKREAKSMTQTETGGVAERES